MCVIRCYAICYIFYIGDKKSNNSLGSLKISILIAVELLLIVVELLLIVRVFQFLIEKKLRGNGKA